MPIALPTGSSRTSPPVAPEPPGATALDLEALFREHHERVFRAAHRVTGNASDAEDVLQTVFMRLLRREDELDLSTSAASYLHRAAVNAALDLLRRRRRRGDVDLEGVETTLEDRREAGPERHRHGRELAADLRQALTRIAPRHAEIFTLRYLEGHGNKEIAAMLGASQTTIAVTLHRVRARLQKDLVAHRGELS